MNSDEIAKVIKKIRTDNNLTQKEFAEILGVTFQAVSKWENGKNIPDISILNIISDKYNIDLKSMLSGKFEESKPENNILIKVVAVLLILILVTLFVIFIFRQDDSLNLKVISTDSSDFEINGCVVFNENNSSIYVDGIEYFGDYAEDVYEVITFTLYEKAGDKLLEIDNVEIINSDKLVFEDIINEVHFNVVNYDASCKSFDSNDLYIDVLTVNDNEKTNSFQVPFLFSDGCICEN